MGPLHTDNLGPPSIEMEGLQIWVHSRQFPDSTDYWDGNWLNITAHCGAKGADVWTSGPIIHLPELSRWAEACAQMYTKLSGAAALDCMEPYLSVRLDLDERGHVNMDVLITPELVNQEHKFCFEVDQSYLPGLIQNCRKVLTDFPIRQASQGGVPPRHE